MTQHTDDISLDLQFSRNHQLSKQVFFHYFTTGKPIKAYRLDGESIELQPTDTILIMSAEKGTYKGHSGNWLFHRSDNYSNSFYIPYTKDIKDVTVEKRAANHVVAEEKAVEKSIISANHFNWFLLYISPLMILLLYVFIKRRTLMTKH